MIQSDAFPIDVQTLSDLFAVFLDLRTGQE